MKLLIVICLASVTMALPITEPDAMQKRGDKGKGMGLSHIMALLEPPPPPPPPQQIVMMYPAYGINPQYGYPPKGSYGGGPSGGSYGGGSSGGSYGGGPSGGSYGGGVPQFEPLPMPIPNIMNGYGIGGVGSLAGLGPAGVGLLDPTFGGPLGGLTGLGR